MRILACSLVLAACGNSPPGGAAPLEPPETCEPGQLSYVHDLEIGSDGGAGDLTSTGHSFVNAFSDTPGELRVFTGSVTSAIFMEFTQLVARGQTVPARGAIEIGDVIVGNCDTAPLSGSLTSVNDDTYKFVLVDLHVQPACSGTAVRGSFAGCFRHNPF